MKQERSSARRSTVVTVLVVLGVWVGGVWFYYTQAQRIRESAETDLQAIAQLKTDQIVAWRAERQGDAAVIMESPFVLKGVVEWMADPAAEGSEDMLTRFRSLRHYYHYRDVLLTDPNGQVLLNLASHPQTLHPDVAQALAAAFRERKPVLCDLHPEGTDQAPHLDLVVPLLAKNGESPKPVAAIVLQIDPERFLYPLIRSWPIPSGSAETLLVRRDGDAVLFLNDLRHRPDTGLKLRIPLTRMDVPAVMAVLGKEGVMQGKDYRGVKVLSVLKAIPDSPWFMVAKVDLAEALSAGRFSAFLILALMLVILVVVAVSVGVIWQRNQKVHYHTLLQTEGKRRASEEKFRVLFEVSSDAIMTLEPPTWRFTSGNPATVKMFKAKDEAELVSKCPWKLSPEFQSDGTRSEDKAKAMITKAMQEGSHFFEWDHLRLDGGVFPATVLLTRVTLGGNVFLQATVRDITESKRAEQKQAELVQKLSEVNQDLKDFAHVVSHDLKAPLRAVRTVADWLCTDYQDKFDERGKENLQLLGKRVDRMQSLIDGVLQYSRVGRTEQGTAPVDLNQLAPAVIDNLAAPEHISIHIENDLPTVEADATRVTQVFQNLLSNAIKYMDKPQGNITVRCVEEDGFWRFSVCDNGPGIEQRHFDRIFKLFQTLAPREGNESTGVGLTITKKIVEMYGGRIWVESEVGKGSTFFFTFPKRQMGGGGEQERAS